MDWYAVAAGLSAKVAPNAVLDDELRVLHCSAAMEALLGRSFEELEGKSLDATGDSAVQAIAPEVAVGGAWVATRDGRHVYFVFERTAVEGGFVVMVREAHEQLAPGSVTSDAALEYEIAPSLWGFGKLLRMRVGEVRRTFWLGEAPLCHDLLHARKEPCVDCPALGSRGPVARGSRTAEAYEVLNVDATPCSIKVRVCRVERDALRAVRELRLREAVEAGGLSTRERAVLMSILDRLAPTAIAEQLNVSVRTVHSLATTALEKLDPSARMELARLFL